MHAVFKGHFAYSPGKKGGPPRTFFLETVQMTASDLLTAEQLAARLHVRPSTVRRWAQESRIPAVRLTPKVIRYELAAVVAAMTNGQEPEGVANDK